MKRTQIGQQAINLRNLGYSYLEISQILKISKDTAWQWTNGIVLDSTAEQRINQRSRNGREASYRVQALNREQNNAKIRLEEERLLIQYEPSAISSRLICALLYWCEGAKKTTSVKFTNSDPNLVRLFLLLLRQSYPIDERKLRALVHIHEYHDDETQKAYWSEVTKIGLDQFNKSYLKPHTGKVKREGYPGCITIAYFDAKVAKSLTALAIAYMNKGT